MKETALIALFRKQFALESDTAIHIELMEAKVETDTYKVGWTDPGNYRQYQCIAKFPVLNPIEVQNEPYPKDD